MEDDYCGNGLVCGQISDLFLRLFAIVVRRGACVVTGRLFRSRRQINESFIPDHPSAGKMIGVP